MGNTAKIYQEQDLTPEQMEDIRQANAKCLAGETEFFTAKELLEKDFPLIK